MYMKWVLFEKSHPPLFISVSQVHFRPSIHTDLVSLLLKFHDLVKIGHTSFLLSLPVQLESSHLQLELLALQLQL